MGTGRTIGLCCSGWIFAIYSASPFFSAPDQPRKSQGENESAPQKIEIPVGGEIIRCEVPSGIRIDRQEKVLMIHGNVRFLLEESDLLISSDSAANLRSPPRGASIRFWHLQWGKFPAVGYTAVLKSIDGPGCAILLEEFGDHPPGVVPGKNTIDITNAAVIRLTPFDSGGYRRVAAIVRTWMKEKGHFRAIHEKPLAKEIAGAVAVRPVQHGAISAELWKKVQPVLPSAVLIWRQTGSPAEGLEHFTPELQARLDKAGRYFFLPWGSMLQPCSAEEEGDELGKYTFSKVPREMFEAWSMRDGKGRCVLPEKMKDTGVNPRKVGKKGLLCHSAQALRMENWLGKVTKHPHHFRLDGINLDSAAALLRPHSYPGNCLHPDHPAVYRDRVAGLEAMFKTAYDRGMMIGHEGNVFFLEKYSLFNYGKAMVSLSLYHGWHLLPTGPDVNPEEISLKVAKHVPVNEMIYHDQLAMRIHDAEALNMRFATPQQTAAVRRIKQVFNALYGLTPNIQLGGPEADRLIREDLSWMKEEMPRAIETYRLLYGHQLVDHRFLSPDRLCQKATYDHGVSVFANFSDEERRVEDITLQPVSYTIRNPEKKGK